MLGKKQASTDLELPINRDVAFIDVKGRYKPGLEKKQRKLLARAAPLLKKVLEPDEQILLITPGCAPFSVFEFLTTGWIIQFVKRCVLVATDRRILHLPTRTNFTPKMSISQILYGDAIGFNVSSFLSTKLVVSYKGGSKETFSVIPRWAAKKLGVILQDRLGSGPSSIALSRQYLCPQCSEVLADDQAICASCGLEFKTRKKALKYSILYPGGGYFYTGHPWLGLGDAIAETVLLLFLGLTVFGAVGPEGDPELWWSVGVVAVLLLLEKLVTVYHAHHYVAERLPADRKFSLS